MDLDLIQAAGNPTRLTGERAGGIDLLATAVILEAAAPKEGEKPAPRKFEMTAYTGGAISVAGWSLPVVIDLAGMSTGNSDRPILIDHNDELDYLLGQTESITKTATALSVVGRIHAKSDVAKRVVELNDDGFKFQASVGASVTNREVVPAGQTARANGKDFSGPLIIARKTVLNEISFVTLGADDNTSARIAAKAAEGNAMDFEQWLAAKGFAAGELSDAQRTYLKAQFDVEKAKPVPGKTTEGDTLDNVLDNERKKAEARTQIVDLTAKALQDSPGQLQVIEAMSRQAMEGDWTPSRYELELLRATRPQAGATARSRSRGDEGMTSDVVEAALCLAGGFEKPEKVFKEQTLDAASKRWNHGLGLGEVLLTFAQRNGHSGLSTRNVGPLLRAAFAEPAMLHASGVSTLSLPGILSNVANKFLRQGFDGVESTWRAIAAIRPVRDFKQITSYSLTGDFIYEEVAPGGQLKHGELGEETYNNQAKTYGRMFGIDRRDIINDDLGALTQVPKRLGRGAALKFNLVFWAAFLDNATFFPTDGSKANYLAGATPGTNDTRMNIEGLTRAETLFLNQTDPDGNPLGSPPKVLLVPNALNTPAMALMNSTEIRDTTSGTVYGTANPHAGKYTIVRSSYLSAAALTGYSVAAWYLLSDPSDLPVIEAAFLNGVETPTVEQADADFNQLGIQMRGYHDFGVAKQEYRGGVKMKGAA